MYEVVSKITDILQLHLKKVTQSLYGFLVFSFSFPFLYIHMYALKLYCFNVNILILYKLFIIHDGFVFLKHFLLFVYFVIMLYV